MISLNINNSLDSSSVTSLESNPQSLPMKALILVVSAVAIAAVGFLVAGLQGLWLGALVGAALGVTIILYPRGNQAQQTQTQELITVPMAVPQFSEQQAQYLVDMYNSAFPFKQKFSGTTAEQANQIQIWMNNEENLTEVVRELFTQIDNFDKEVKNNPQSLNEHMAKIIINTKKIFAKQMQNPPIFEGTIIEQAQGIQNWIRDEENRKSVENAAKLILRNYANNPVPQKDLF
jgi:hypothetical protein